MRHVVVHESLKETEARPPGAFAHLVERSLASAKSCSKTGIAWNYSRCVRRAGRQSLRSGSGSTSTNIFIAFYADRFGFPPDPHRRNTIGTCTNPPRLNFDLTRPICKASSPGCRDVALPR